MVENMAAVELNQSYISVSGDAINLGVIRTDSVNTTAGIVVSDDATIHKLSIGENPKFKVIVEAGKVLTIQEKSGLEMCIRDSHIAVHSQQYNQDHDYLSFQKRLGYNDYLVLHFLEQ